MDYEKKYMDALAKARDMMSYKEVRREDMEYLFPELAESEGERIRKWLISQLNIKSNGTDSDLDIMVDKAIAWLEKQGEQKKDICEGCNNIKGCVTCVDGSEKAKIMGNGTLKAKTKVNFEPKRK